MIYIFVEKLYILDIQYLTSWHGYDVVPCDLHPTNAHIVSNHAAVGYVPWWGLHKINFSSVHLCD